MKNFICPSIFLKAEIATLFESFCLTFFKKAAKAASGGEIIF